MRNGQFHRRSSEVVNRVQDAEKAVSRLIAVLIEADETLLDIPYNQYAENRRGRSELCETTNWAYGRASELAVTLQGLEQVQRTH